ncbi:hypothetical protein ACFQ6C_35180, partial [Streptomyces sp. NPDC056454]
PLLDEGSPDPASTARSPTIARTLPAQSEHKRPVNDRDQHTTGQSRRERIAEELNKLSGHCA